MASPFGIVKERQVSLQPVEATATNIKYTMRGEWEPGTGYNLNDYVYTSRAPGFLYVATVAGTSQSAVKGRSSLEEPAWDILAPFTYDGCLQFVPVEVTEAQSLHVRKWVPSTLYEAESLVAPSSGPIVVRGVENQYFVFKLNKCVTNIDWPREPRTYIQDNDITWECHLSYGKLLPAARLQEPMYAELVEIMDFLRLHEELYFDDLTYKFADQIRVRSTSVKETIAEFGYSYITDFVGLTDKELHSAIEYLSLIHYLKGSAAGLSLVFEILGVTARWEEWWESTPPGPPDTWKLWVDTDISKAHAALTTRIINFTRQYVYPIMQEFEASYNVNLIQLVATIGGFMDAEYRFNLSQGNLLMQGVGTYIDKEYSFNLSAEVRRVIGSKKHYIGKVFGFSSLYAGLGTWGSNWQRYNYDTNDTDPIAIDHGYPEGDGYNPSDITEAEALALISAETKKP